MLVESGHPRCPEWVDHGEGNSARSVGSYRMTHSARLYFRGVVGADEVRVGHRITLSTLYAVRKTE
jgi:hypothetical protein